MIKTMAVTMVGSVRCLSWWGLDTLTPEKGERLISDWVSSVFASGNATLRAEGADKLNRDAAYLYMSNHTSLLDIPAVLGAVPGRLRMISKAEVQRIPVFGPALTKMQFIFIERGRSQQAIAQLEKAKDLLAKGISVWIAPEGTRTRDGRVGDFKKGGFHLALQLGVPIVPTWIEGASEILPPDTFRAAYDGEVVVRFGEPIDTAGRESDLMGLLEDVREAMLALSGRPRDEVSAS
jgi:1-acyl-sn-glycerol-3-phosphate acyltransferase